MSGYPPSRFEDIKQSEAGPMSGFERSRNLRQDDIAALASNFSQPIVMNARVEIPRAAMNGAAFATSLGTYATTVSAGSDTHDIRPAKRGLFEFRSTPATGKMTISKPILEANGDQNPLNKIATISLEEAARDERQRRTNDIQRDSALIAKRPAPQPPNMSAEEALKRSVSLKRKDVAYMGPQPPMPTTSMLEPIPMAMTSSAELSPGAEELRRRSPGQPPVDRTYRPAQNRETFLSTSTVTTMPSPTIPLPSPRQLVPEQMTQDQIEEMELREEMERIDQLQQAVFVLNEPQVPTAPASAFAMPARPTEPAVPLDSALRNPYIRPSRRLPDSPKATSPEPTKTPLQRRPTNGLPRNPRAVAAYTVEKEGAAGRQQTVLFMNDIVYNDPQIVQNIMDGANVNSKSHNRDSSLSIVHRPRPIPRWQEIDRAIFPAEPSPHGHRRTKSGGSVMTRRKSALSQLHPGSPTQLPPLPLPPTVKAMQTAYNMERPSANRPQPNDTKSMTFDEKMKLLYPTSPGSATDSVVLRRRSLSVPEMPPVPRDYIPIALSPIHGDGSNSRMSASTARTGRTSVKTENIFDVDELLSNTRFYPDPLKVASGVAAGDRGAGGKRASSPLLPPQIRDSAITASSEARTHDDGTTNWGSVHSPVYAVPIPANRLVARTTYINGGDQRTGASEGPLDADLPLLPATTYIAQPRVPAPARAREISPPASPSSRPASDKGLDGQETNSPEQWGQKTQESQWHRRIGDDTLSFSERKERTRSRKMPPPTPLLLRNAQPSTKNPVVVKAAQPSPLESPERALAYIQAQLRKYEEPHLPGSAAEETPTRRLALLDNLEKEMDMQAGHWQQMQHNLRHGSMSTMQTLSPSVVDSRHQSVRQSHYSISSVLAQQQKAARQSYMDSGTLGVFNYIASDIISKRSSNVAQQHFPNTLSEIGDLGSPTPPDSDNEETDLDLRLHRELSDAIDLALFDSAAAPPSPIAKSLQTAQHNNLPSLLWTPKEKQTMAMTALWTPASAAASQQSTALFASISQSAARQAMAVNKSQASGPLLIESVSLWSKDVSPLSKRKDSGRGLWTDVQSQEQSQEETIASVHHNLHELEMEMEAMEADHQRMSTSSQKAPRPVTQRPPRRSRRATLLPDILESPKPLPDKRGTLGIFQFPWGERSDTAKAPVSGAPFAMPGTMASGGGQFSASLEARAKQLEMDEYSASFFDDYDDDEEDEDYDSSNGLDEQDLDNEGSDSDDGFDENTLWEIASLLKSEQVPSKMSLLPPPHPTLSGSVVDDYMADAPSDSEIDQFERSIVDDNGIIMGLSLNNAIMQQEEEKPIETQLWRGEKKSHRKTASVGEPDEETWMSYNTVSQAATLRSKPRKAVQPAQVETSQLWDQSTVVATKDQPIKPLPATLRSSLWTAETVQPEKEVTQAEKAPESKMWTARSPAKANELANTKLFDLEAAIASKLALAVTRTTELEPAALLMARTPRAIKAAPLEQLTSTGLWAPASKAVKSHMWTPRKVVQVKTVTMLFDKDAAMAFKMASAVTRTTDLEPAALGMMRKVRTFKAAPLATLESTSLWTPVKRSGSGMWAPRPAVKVAARSIGLFDKEVAAAVKLASALTRTTHLEPAALSMPRKVRTNKAAPLDKLESTSLWATTKPFKQYMWAPRPAFKAALHKTGLFDKQAAVAAKLAVAITRTTDLAPAALHMIRKTRSPKPAPLEKLQSANLWAPVKRSVPQGMWAPRPVMKSTTRKAHLFDKEAAAAAKMATAVTRTTDLEPAALKMPRTPRAPKAMPLEKLTSTSLWAAKSVPASRMWAPMPAPKVQAKGFLFDRDVAAAEKMHMPIRTTTAEPAAIVIPRTPRSFSHLAELQLESSSLWAVPTIETMSPRSTDRKIKRMTFNWIMAQDSRSIPLIQDMTIPATNVGIKQMTWWETMKAAASLAPPAAPAGPSMAEIEAEIDSVRMALPSTPVLLRPAASERDSMDALDEAVEASYPFDSALKHPAMASSSVPSPGADNDASKLHPVFFQPPKVVEQIQLVSAADAADAAYHAHIAAMENQALARLQALEGY